jgi:hypothetical protein
MLQKRLVLSQLVLHHPQRIQVQSGTLGGTFLRNYKITRSKVRTTPLGTPGKDIPTEITPFFLEFGPFDPYAGIGSNSNPPLVDRTGPVDLPIPFFHFYICLPGFIFRFPLHPAFEDLPSAGDILKQFLKIYILVPKLFDAGEKSDCPVKEIACMLHIPRLELLKIFTLALGPERST